MASFISSIVLLFCLSSFFFPSAPAVATTISSHLSHGGGGGGGGGSDSGGGGLLKIACTVDYDVADPETWDYNLCIKVLKSNQNIVSSRDLPSVALSIINIGISNVSNTYAYIQSTLKRRSIRPTLMNALKACDKSYQLTLENFQSALRDIKVEGDYEAASNDLSAAHSDSIDICRKAIASNKVGDPSILSGNKFAQLFSVAADVICTRLFRMNKDFLSQLVFFQGGKK